MVTRASRSPCKQLDLWGEWLRKVTEHKPRSVSGRLTSGNSKTIAQGQIAKDKAGKAEIKV